MPDLTVDLESTDMSCELEAILTRVDADNIVAGQEFDFLNAKPLDIISPWKGGGGSYAIAAGVILPYLSVPENITYRFGVGNQKATQSFSLRGDSIYAAKLVPYWDRYPEAGAGPYVFDHTAVETVEQGEDVFALCVTVYHVDGSYERLFHGVDADYTDSAANFTLTSSGADKIVAGDELEVVYFSAFARTTSQDDHPTASVKPRDILGSNIDLYISDGMATPTLLLKRGIQTVEFNRRVNLERDEELGNPHAVESSYETADVNGTVTIRPVGIDYLFETLSQITGVPEDKVINVLSRVPLEMQARIRHPDTADVIKTLVVEDARFTFPGPQVRVQQKQDLSMPWSSDGGRLLVVNGIPT